VPGSLVGSSAPGGVLAYDQPQAPIDRDVRQGLRISSYSLGWTIVAGTCVIVIGVIGNSLTLVVFGIVGLLDAVGSGTLILHFRHAIRHEAISPQHERMTLLVVSAGMATVGVATIADSVYRLIAHVNSRPLLPGIVLAAVSVVVLTTLSSRKRRIARRIPSGALHADGWLSAMGAVLACVVLLGTTLDKAFAWWWIDPLAAIVVACGAISLSILLMRPTAMGAD
jgi:divalent metal cation (Fe/Co/Zn/Cd) transporter